jgi:hypothetical protein
MNATGPLPISGEIAPPPVARTFMEPPVHLTRLLLGLAVVVGIFDLCFWGVRGAGCSVAIFAVVLAFVILGNRERATKRRVTKIILGLLAGAALGTVIETGPTNIIVLLILIGALAGDSYFTRVDSFWGRGLSQGVALLFAPGRVFWLGARLLEATFRGGRGSLGRLLGGLLLTVPALVLALVFGSLLATGNAVFGSWTNSFFDWLWKEIGEYLNVYRFTLWIFVAFAMLPLLRPASISDRWWSWTGRLPRLPEVVPAQGAFFSSALVLIVLNILFLVANAADALFLWTGTRSLPPGVTYRSYVHNGVNALTLTVILSALILTFIFQQALQVAGRRELKALAVLWIAQNLFLLLSVALRLKLYIEAYAMTVDRLSVIIFLLFVTSGFGLLTVKIVKDRSLSWLVGGCAVAVFVTLYGTQFLNLAGWSATYNVARWEGDRTRTLDLRYIDSVGPAGWPAFRSAAEEGVTWAGPGTPQQYIYSLRVNETQAHFDLNHWREFSLRAWLNRGALEEKPK